MNRRELITFVGGAAVVGWDISVRAQQPQKVPRVGLLAPGRADAAPNVLTIRIVNAFKKALGDHGYIENRNVDLKIRWDEGQIERNDAIAAELVSVGVDVIVAGTTQATFAAREATRTIPIVAAALGGGDPVELGLADSLSRPGGNVTGVVLLTHVLPGKRLQLIKEAVPNLSRIVLLWYDPRTFPRQDYEMAAQALGVRLDALQVRGPEAFEESFQAARDAKADAVVLSQGSFFAGYAVRIAELALKYRLPTMSGETGFAQLGGFMNYGPDIVEAWRNAATYVDKILKGAKARDLPMEQAMRFEFVINLKTANSLGLTLPPTLLALADEVIE
jgi:putative tryptophan/tyrosine transport system substrate-binding protein